MESLDWTPVILAILTLLGVIGGPYLALRQKHIEQKAQAEVARTKDRDHLIEQMQVQINELDDDLRAARAATRLLHTQLLVLQTTVAEWEVGVRILSQQVIRMGEVPDWVPRESTPPSGQ